MIRRFARPYAKALMGIAQSPEASREIHKELTQFETARSSSPQLVQAFVSPAVDAATKISLVRSIAAKMGMSALAVKVLEVLVANHRINDLSSVLDAWRELLNRSLGVAMASVVTAHELLPAERQALVASLEKRLGSRVELDLAVDPALLGGFVATVGSEVWDASVVGRIRKLRNAIQ